MWRQIPYANGLTWKSRLVARWFDTSAFTFPGDGVLGNGGRAVGRGPRFVNFDLSLLKDWRWAERKTVQLRGDFFNILNHPNFGLPNNQRGNNAFGAINSTVNDGRVVQLGLKVNF